MGAQNVLSGVFTKIENRWQRSASTIQRNVRVKVQRMTTHQARQFPRAQAPLRGSKAEGTAVGLGERKIPVSPPGKKPPAQSPKATAGRVADYIIG